MNKGILQIASYIGLFISTIGVICFTTVGNVPGFIAAVSLFGVSGLIQAYADR